ncbi:MAG: hypothetical protein ACF8GE_03585 [Phycisphaerales bacterium JB043]
MGPANPHEERVQTLLARLGANRVYDPDKFRLGKLYPLESADVLFNSSDCFIIAHCNHVDDYQTALDHNLPQIKEFIQRWAWGYHKFKGRTLARDRDIKYNADIPYGILSISNDPRTTNHAVPAELSPQCKFLLSIGTDMLTILLDHGFLLPDVLIFISTLKNLVGPIAQHEIRKRIEWYIQHANKKALVILKKYPFVFSEQTTIPDDFIYLLEESIYNWAFATIGEPPHKTELIPAKNPANWPQERRDDQDSISEFIQNTLLLERKVLITALASAASLALKPGHATAGVQDMNPGILAFIAMAMGNSQDEWDEFDHESSSIIQAIQPKKKPVLKIRLLRSETSQAINYQYLPCKPPLDSYSRQLLQRIF